MDLGLAGKRAIVTGSTAGIGLAAAEALAREGAHVVVNGRTAARVDSAVAQLRKALPAAKIEGVAADLGTAEGCTQLIRSIPHADILVNNLGVFAPIPFEEITDEQWMSIFEVNVLSGVRLARHYVKGMRDRDFGRIVFVSSESGVQIPTEMIHYGVTKTAQIAVARGLAETLVGTNVTVNSVLPGPTSSEGVSTFVEQLATSQGKELSAFEREFFKEARPSSVIQRFAKPAEIASMIAYVCSAAASATTGAALRVDGGVIRAVV